MSGCGRAGNGEREGAGEGSGEARAREAGKRGEDRVSRGSASAKEEGGGRREDVESWWLEDCRAMAQEAGYAPRHNLVHPSAALRVVSRTFTYSQATAPLRPITHAPVNGSSTASGDSEWRMAMAPMAAQSSPNDPEDGEHGSLTRPCLQMEEQPIASFSVERWLESSWWEEDR
ncbi:hypothetical protein C8F01DRAFT_1079909 [Mycena amicta]|nr:hypothetical protein C8F01DRAFT_1079909 [Mycena amicta]